MISNTINLTTKLAALISPLDFNKVTIQEATVRSYFLEEQYICNDGNLIAIVQEVKHV